MCCSLTRHTLSHGAGSPSRSQVHILPAEDDSQSFLEMLKSCGRPAAELAMLLLPLLSGEAQTAVLRSVELPGCEKSLPQSDGLLPQESPWPVRDHPAGVCWTSLWLCAAVEGRRDQVAAARGSPQERGGYSSKSIIHPNHSNPPFAFSPSQDWAATGADLDPQGPQEQYIRQ